MTRLPSWLVGLAVLQIFLVSQLCKTQSARLARLSRLFKVKIYMKYSSLKDKNVPFLLNKTFAFTFLQPRLWYETQHTLFPVLFDKLRLKIMLIQGLFTKLLQKISSKLACFHKNMLHMKLTQIYLSW